MLSVWQLAVGCATEAMAASVACCAAGDRTESCIVVLGLMLQRAFPRAQSAAGTG